MLAAKWHKKGNLNCIYFHQVGTWTTHEGLRIKRERKTQQHDHSKTNRTKIVTTIFVSTLWLLLICLICAVSSSNAQIGTWSTKMGLDIKHEVRLPKYDPKKPQNKTRVVTSIMVSIGSDQVWLHHYSYSFSPRFFNSLCHLYHLIDQFDRCPSMSMVIILTWMCYLQQQWCKY